MTMTRFTRSAALACAVFALSGCGQGVSAPSSSSGQASGTSAGRSQPVTVESCGQKTTYASSSRIAALDIGMADLAKRLGAGDRIVAVAQTHGKNAASVLGGSPQVLSEDAPPTREQLLKVTPDLVLSPTTYEFTGEKGFATQDQLKKAGATPYVASAGCFARRAQGKVTDMLTDIDNLGKILGAEQQATALKGQAQGVLDEAKKRAEGEKPQTVAQLFVQGDTVTAIGAGVENDIARAAGGKPVFNPDDPAFAKFFAAEVSRETVVQKNPDVIVFSVTDPEHEKQARAWIEKNLAQTTAVKQHRLVAVDATEVLPGTWGNLDAVTTISKALYPGA